MSTARSGQYRDAGVTLAELAVYIVLLAIIGTIVSTVVLQSFRSEETVSGVTQASNQGQNFSVLFRGDIANANAATVATGGQQVVLCTYPTDAATVRTQVTWSLTGGKVSRAVGTTSPATIVESIQSGSTFTRVGTSGVEYRLNITADAGGVQTLAGTSSFTVQEGATC